MQVGEKLVNQETAGVNTSMSHQHTQERIVNLMLYKDKKGGVIMRSLKAIGK